MKDQAEGLRQIVKSLREQQRPIEKTPARIITITSGKGGVGKTSFTVNLAICLGEMGFRVLIIDGDFGLSNVDLMLGIIPKHNLNQAISGQIDFGAVATEGPSGIRFISGGSGLNELIHLKTKQLEDFLTKIAQLDQMADIVLIDTGAGVTDKVIKMILAAHEVILVTTPEPTAITDAYALAKTIALTGYNTQIKLLVNKAEDDREGNAILQKFEKVTKGFLDIDIEKLGYLYNDFHVPKSIKQQHPYITSYPKSQISKQVQQIAMSLISKENQCSQKPEGMAAYVRRFLDIFK